jgi:hypothetical protein
LESEGIRKFKGNHDRAARWKEGCQNLKKHIRRPGTTQSQGLRTDMREFFQAFEHEGHRIYQMSLSGSGWTPKQVLIYLDLIYKHSTYAILAAHIPDRQASNTLLTRLYMTIGPEGVTSTSTTTDEFTEPRGRRKYRRARKRPGS